MRIPIESDALMRTAARYQEQAHAVLATSVRHLSTGQRVSSAIDDASGLAIAQRMQAQYEGLLQAGRNAQDGLNFLGIADSALGRTTDMLQRIRVIALQAATDTYTDHQRVALQGVVDHTLDEIDAVARTTTYGGRTLLDGSRPQWTLQVGAFAGQTVTIDVRAADRIALGLAGAPTRASAAAPDDSDADASADAFAEPDDVAGMQPGTPATVETSDVEEALVAARAAFVQAAQAGPISVRTRDAATASLDVLDRALTYVLAERAEFGAASVRLELMIQSLGVSADAARATAARITDADLPAEVATMLRAQIAAEASAHMMAQAQHTQALVLELLRPLDLPFAPATPVTSGGASSTAPSAPARTDSGAFDSTHAAPVAARAADPVTAGTSGALGAGAVLAGAASARPVTPARTTGRGSAVDTGAFSQLVGASGTARGAAHR